MNLQSCPKLEHGRCVPPEETVARLEAMLSARHAYWIHQEQVHELLHWSALFLDDDPAFRAMGKGVTAALSRAGALAEAAESLTALPVEALPGYRFAPEEEVENAVTFAELLPQLTEDLGEPPIGQPGLREPRDLPVHQPSFAVPAQADQALARGQDCRERRQPRHQRQRLVHAHVHSSWKSDRNNDS